jgi:hypothetical protein
MGRTHEILMGAGLKIPRLSCGFVLFPLVSQIRVGAGLNLRFRVAWVRV